MQARAARRRQDATPNKVCDPTVAKSFGVGYTG